MTTGEGLRSDRCDAGTFSHVGKRAADQGRKGPLRCGLCVSVGLRNQDTREERPGCPLVSTTANYIPINSFD